MRAPAEPPAATANCQFVEFDQPYWKLTQSSDVARTMIGSIFAQLVKPKGMLERR